MEGVFRMFRIVLEEFGLEIRVFMWICTSVHECLITYCSAIFMYRLFTVHNCLTPTYIYITKSQLLSVCFSVAKEAEMEC